MFSNELKRALYACSNDAAPDMGEGGDDAECVAEACFSMLDYGYKKEREELTSLIAARGYRAVLKEAARHVGTL